MSNKDLTPAKNYKGRELPNGNRPSSFDDLSWSKKQENSIYSLDGEIAENPELLPLWKAMVETANTIPELSVKGTEIVLKNTPKVIERKIEESAEAYDKERDRVHLHVNGVKRVEYYYQVSDYLNAESLTLDTDEFIPAGDDSE